MAPDWKPPSRIVNSKAQPVDATPLLAGVCPLCKRHVGRDRLTRHHVVPKGQGGDDVPENLVWACGHGTVGCHGVLTHRNRDGETGLTFDDVGAALLEYLLKVYAVRAYTDVKQYDGWLEDYYAPSMSEAA